MYSSSHGQIPLRPFFVRLFYSIVHVQVGCTSRDVLTVVYSSLNWQSYSKKLSNPRLELLNGTHLPKMPSNMYEWS